MPYLPDTEAVGEIDTSGVLDYDVFAWNSFVAMNWPVAQTITEEATTVHRGIPDLNQSFKKAANNVLTVWESLKEKREVFLFDEATDSPVLAPQPTAWNASPSYGGTPIPACSGSPPTPFPREMVQSTKLVFDNLDETAEVASEARESNSALCAGNEGAPGCLTAIGSASVAGAPVGPRVYYGQPKSGTSTTPVVYEVKVNYDFYEYLRQFELPSDLQIPGVTYVNAAGSTPLWEQNNAVVAAANGRITLPVRTSDSHLPPRPGNHGSAPYGINPRAETGYSALACLKNNAKAISNNEPCLAGSVHLKAAWIDLKEAGITPTVVGGLSTWPNYHTATGYTYRTVAGTEPPLCRQTTTLGLVGLHIIQRIHESSKPKTGKPQSRGGNFIYATFEHVANDPTPGQAPPFNYANLYPTTSKSPKPYPNVKTRDALPLHRYYDVPLNVAKANDAMHAQLGCQSAPSSTTPNSVWCSYRLIGTQYAADGQPKSVNPKTTFRYSSLPTKPLPAVISDHAKGQHHYLANLVIESNLGLQQFQGLPPGIVPIPHFNIPGVPPGTTTGKSLAPSGVQPNPYSLGAATTTTPVGSSTAYDVAAPNTAFRIAPQGNSTPSAGFNMGGCMGCHGVAQQLGYAFSFVLLGNQSGAAIDTQQEVEIPPNPNSLPPSGSYQATCDQCTVSGTTLSCSCLTRSQQEKQTWVDFVSCERSLKTIENADGNLQCGSHGSYLPPGSYVESCSGCKTNGKTLSCSACVTRAQTNQASTLDYSTCQRNSATVVNNNGKLECGATASALPAGSYQTSCSDCLVSLNTLSCKCPSSRSQVNFATCLPPNSLNVASGKLVCN